MADHVAVLRKMRDELAADRDGARLAASLDHAIAACEQHAALVARLGEADALIRRVIDADWRTNDNTLYPALLAWADHAARAQTTRVVAGNGGGDGG